MTTRPVAKMVRELVARREAVMDAADRALRAAWPQRHGSAYVAAMRSAEGELARIAEALDRAGAPDVERSRALRYRASILSDLAPAEGQALLGDALDVLAEAEALLGGDADAVERAIVDFNVGNTLRVVEPVDPEKLREAERRFLAARDVFARRAPDHVQRVDQALASTRALTATARLARAIDGDLADMAELQRRIATGEDATQLAPDVTEVMGRGGGVAGRMAEIQGLLAGLPDDVRADPRYAEVVGKLAEVGAASAVGDAVPLREQPLLDLLGQRLAAELQAGRVGGDRARVLRDALERFVAAARSADDDVKGGLRKVATLWDLAESLFEVQHYLSHGLPRPVPGTRAAQLVELWWTVRLAVLRECVERDKSPAESETVARLLVRTTELDRLIYEAGDDDARARALERERLRPTALEVRDFGARHLPLLARPLWPASRVPVDPNTVVFAGAAEAGRVVEGACHDLGLDLLAAPRGDVAIARWRQLQQASIGVFDLGAAEGPELAAVAYELGVGRALGRAVVVLAREARRVPFDIDVQPTTFHGDTRDAGALREALDAAAVWVMPRPRADASAAEAADVLRQYPRPGPNPYADQTLRVLQQSLEQPGPLQTGPDPLAIRDALRGLVSYLPEPAPMLIHPPWLPYRAAPGARRLFHVMPFGPTWSAEVADIVRTVCADVGVDYVRGDEVPEPDVIRSIWEEIGRASHVLVDLTGFNANVALELGLAHLLGRATEIVGQGDTVERLFPNVAKLRVHRYALGGDELRRRVREYLTNGRRA